MDEFSIVRIPSPKTARKRKKGSDVCPYQWLAAPLTRWFSLVYSRAGSFKVDELLLKPRRWLSIGHASVDERLVDP